MINVFQPSLGQEELTAIKQVFDMASGKPRHL